MMIDMDDGRDEFLRLFLPHEQDLRAFIGSMVRDRHAREDVLQDVAMTLWREFGRYDRTRSFGAWARGVASHKVLQHRQRDRRFPLAFAPETIRALRDAFDRTEATAQPKVEALLDCVELLPAKVRSLLALRYRDGLRADEMAQKLRSSVDAVHQALSRTRAALKECVRRRMLESGDAR